MDDGSISNLTSISYGKGSLGSKNGGKVYTVSDMGIETRKKVLAIFGKLISTGFEGLKLRETLVSFVFLVSLSGRYL